MQTVSAVILGLAFGVVFERYYFCMNSTITDVFLFRDTSKLKGLLTAILVSAVLFNLLIGLGVREAAAMPLWPTTIFAGVIFGIGMNLAGGCVSGTLFKMGQGYVASLIACLGVVLALGTTGIMMSFLPMPGGEMRPAQMTTLPKVLDLNPLLFTVLVVAAFLAGYWAWRRHGRRGRPEGVPPESGNRAAKREGWPRFVVGGVLVAVLNTILFAVFSHPLGLAGLMAYAASLAAYLADSSWASTNPMFGYLLNNPRHGLMGLLFLIGAILSALVAGRFQFRLPARRQAVSSLIGGYLMGVGTAMMVGCNVTHILGGLPQFGVGSITATLGIVIGAWLGTRLMTRIVAGAA